MYSDYSGSGAAYLALLLILIPIILIFSLIFYVIAAFFLMKVFDKAGVQGKWRAWVPVYNTMVLGKLGDVSPWIVLGASVATAVLSQIPVIGWIFSIVAIAVLIMYAWRVGLKFGQDWYYLLLFLIPGLGALIWLGILAFGSSRWNPNIAPSPWANTFLADKTVWQGIPVQPGAAAAGPGGYPGTGPAAPGSYPPPPAGYTPPAPGGSTPPPPAPGGPAAPGGPGEPPTAPEPPRP
ncbi:large exoprotein [Microbacterium sp. A1-JK]|uniref:large exoprotein n=1 Tax=Microbacterium sp. A1-JK TaxID=3177516 RepID=UPI00388A3558